MRESANGEKVFGRYTLKKILGRGGMGIVWLAHDAELEREVALKFLPETVVHDRSLLNDLKRETRRSLELTHKNIVRIHDFVHDESSACISMEYIDGDTLSNLRAEKEQKVFQPEEIAAWTSQLCEALDYAHNHARIIHRDLKPANLMVNKKGDLKVSDFGIARSLGDSMSKLTMASGTSGTLVYMSPQQLDGERGTHLDDVYSLGATIYDLLTSKPPFYSGNIDRQIHERTAPSMTERRKEFNLEPAFVPPVWETAVAACLAKDPAHRPQSAAEVANRLQLSAPRSGTVTVASKKQPKRQTLWIGLVAFGLVALAGFYFGILKPRHSATVIDRRYSEAGTPSPTPAIPEKSIAVLPFENLSAEKETPFSPTASRTTS
ncbi:MAG: serine/threonine protein kinase [Verrucomicrobiota bacterium]|nr:serine/threonine protein kinase [Verrucomicrobiota bacterium]